MANWDLTVPVEEAPANSVPAAAVIRGVQALFGFIGRKGRVGGRVSLVCKRYRSTERLHWILHGLRAREVSRMSGVAVECVDITQNTCGEGGSLARI
jgi:hypothetical protein